MASKPRGRGYALSKGAQSMELRRPGEAGLLERFGNASQNNTKESSEPKVSVATALPKPAKSSSLKNPSGVVSQPIPSPAKEASKVSVATALPKPAKSSPSLKNPSGVVSQPVPSPAKEASKPVEEDFAKLCVKIAEMELTLPKSKLDAFAEELQAICKTSGELERCADNICQFALQSKWNAHVIAVFCNSHGDITVDQVKLRNILFKKLQGHYNERNKAYLELDKFLLHATFACEIFHHVRVAGLCLKVLAHPILDYFGMLVSGASQKEIEVFIEQFPKCYKNLKENDSNGLEDLLTKIRKQIISETTTVTVKTMLLEMFELVLTDWKDLNPSAKFLYETLSKPVVRICE